MSNDPFNDPPAAMNSAQTAPPKKGLRGCLIGCGVVSGLALLVCCGGGFWAISFGTKQMAKEITPRMEGNPVIEEHIGDLESLSFDLIETYNQMAEAQENGETGVLIFRINGNKGDGELHFNQDGNNEIDFDSCELVMPDGSRYPVDLSRAGDHDGFDIDDLDMNMDDLIDSGDSVVDPPSFETPTEADSPNQEATTGQETTTTEEPATTTEEPATTTEDSAQEVETPVENETSGEEAIPGKTAPNAQHSNQPDNRFAYAR